MFAQRAGMHPHERGKFSEDIAAEFLTRRGYSILARNYRVNRKEIDIVAQRGRTIAFIEVKARAGAGYGHPSEAITWKKRREIAYAARAWLARNPLPADCELRFDAVSVVWKGGSWSVEHAENAWHAD